MHIGEGVKRTQIFITVVIYEWSLLSFELAAKRSSLAFCGARESLLKMAEEGVLARRWWLPWWFLLWQVME